MFTEQANKARWGAGVQPETPEDEEKEDSEAGSKAPSQSSPLREMTVTVGAFGTDKPPPNHRQNEIDGGSRESRTASDSSVANDDLVKAARQQMKDGKTKH